MTKPSSIQKVCTKCGQIDSYKPRDRRCKRIYEVARKWGTRPRLYYCGGILKRVQAKKLPPQAAVAQKIQHYARLLEKQRTRLKRAETAAGKTARKLSYYETKAKKLMAAAEAVQAKPKFNTIKDGGLPVS